jgi:stage II sporulation protein M
MLYKTLDLKLNPLRESNYSYTQLFAYSALTFLIAIIIGILFNQYIAEFAYQYFLAPTLDMINYISTIYDNLFLLMLLIFFKNCLAIILCLYLTRRTRGASIALLLGMNGIIIGAILTMCYLMDMSLVFILAGIMPHGIFEFTAVFFGTALGLKLLFAKEEELSEYKIEVNNKVIKILIPLLLMAAFVEVYITPMFMSMVE